MRTVIIGNHAAGISAAETTRLADRSIEIVMISMENTPPYSRCLLPFLLSGEKKTDDILFRDPGFYESHKIKKMFGREVLRVLPGEKCVLLDKGEKLVYDRLIIATGGSPQTVTIPGVRNEGVTSLRSLSDAMSIVAMMDRVQNAVVLGAGLVGIKAAYALGKAGKNVTILASSPSILSQIVNERESSIIEKYLSGTGIKILKNTSPARILGAAKAEGVETTAGEKLDCELVIVGKGVSANRSLAEGSGITTGYGIITDDACATNVGDIFAAGDVAQSRDSVRDTGWMNTLWPHAVEEGRVAALSALGLNATLRQRTSMNSLVIGDLTIVSCGLTGARDGKKGSEEIVHVDPRTGAYKRFTLYNDRLVGYVLIGNIVHAGVLTALVTRGVSVAPVISNLKQGAIDFALLFDVMRENASSFVEKDFDEVLSFVKGESGCPRS